VKPRLFISYRRSKAARVDALVSALEAEGVEVWLDRNEIEDAASIQGRIEDGLASCHALLAWYCADYSSSRACQWELTAALIAAGAETSPVVRILVINPEADNGHIQPLKVRDLKHISAQDHDAALAHRIAEIIRPIQGALGALRRLGRPAAFGFTPIGSTRFVGRVVRMWDIHSALGAGNFAIVAGLPSSGAAGELVRLTGGGGIGKSLLTEEYALRFGASWPGGLFWLRAYGNSDDPNESPEALAERRELAYGSQLVSFCNQLGIDTREKTNAQLRAELGRTLTTPYLWIVDDLPDGGRFELDPWLAPSSNGRTLITTRSRGLDGLGTALELELLDAKDALALLTDGKPAQPADEGAITHIGELLDGHALALDVARAACRRLGFRRFCDRLENPDADAMALAAEIAHCTPSGHTPYIAATLLGSIKQLEEPALDCIRIASLLAATAIPLELVSNCLARADGLDKSHSEDAAALGIQTLVNRSLADEVEAVGAFTVHALIARTLRFCDAKGLPRRDELQAAMVQELVHQMQRAADVREHAALQWIVPHAQLFAKRFDDIDCIHIAGWIGRLELEAGRFDEAESWYRQEYARLLRLVGDEHPSTLDSVHQLAATLSAKGKFAEARALKEKVLKLCSHVLGTEHPSTLAAMNSLVTAMRDQGDFDGALLLGDELLGICRRVLGEYHLGTLTCAGNIASILAEVGEHAQAERVHRVVLEAKRQALGSEHPSTLASMSNVATSLFDQGNYAQAKSLQEEVLSLFVRVLGTQHPDTLSGKCNLAASLGGLGDFAGAKKLEEEVLEVQRRLLGEEHPDTLTTMFNLGVSLANQGDHNESQSIKEHVISVRRRVWGEEHPDTLADMFRLASALLNQGKNAEAISLKMKILEIRRRSLGNEHADTIDSIRDLARTLESQGDLEAARAHNEQSLAIDFRASGELFGIDRKLRERVLKIWRMGSGQQHPDTTVKAWELLQILITCRDFRAARSLIESDLRWLAFCNPDSLSRAQQQVRRMLGDLPNDLLDAFPSVLAPTESTCIEVDPSRMHVPTHLALRAGQTYSFAVSGKWKDWLVVCDHQGWGSGWLTRFNRVKGHPFFRLCGCIGQHDKNAFVIDTSQPWTVPNSLAPDDDCELYLFANDHRWMYWNNRILTEAQGGPLRVTIARIE
jgi:tetratricopeptide (TPR) repeat protein